MPVLTTGVGIYSVIGGGGGGSVSITQLDHGEDATTSNVYTFTSKSTGVAASNRFVIIGISTRFGGTTITSLTVTVGLVSATKVVSAANTTGGNTTLSELWIAAVPTGTSDNVVVTYSAGVLRCGLNMWRMVGAASGTASASGSSVVDPTTATIIIPNNGSAVGYVVSDFNGGSGAISWTNLTQSLAITTITGSFRHGAAMADFVSGGSTALTGDMSAATSIDSPSGVFAAWSP